MNRPDPSQYSMLVAVGGTHLDWSPDGERVAFSLEGNVWTVFVSSGDPSTLLRGDSPSWSPDGEAMAYHLEGPIVGRINVYVLIDGAPPGTLLAPGGNPDWSPNASSIALDTFSSTTLTEGILVVSSTGGDVDRVAGFGQQPDWSPDSQRIAFCTRNCDSLGIWTVCPDGDSLFQLTTGYHWSPRWSPDGRWIAYHTYYDWQLYVIPSGGGRPIPITGGPETKAWPAWSPDGDRIAFSSYNDETGEWEIWIASNLPF